MPRHVSVTNYLDDLDHRHADAVMVLRQLVLHRGVAVKDATRFSFDDPAELVGQGDLTASVD